MQFKEPLGNSDHLTLEMYYVANANKQHSHSTNAKRFSYDRGDYDKMRKMLQEVDWEVELQGLDANFMMLFIESKIYTTMEECIPQYQINNENKDPLWMNNNIMKIIKMKHNAYKRWLLTKKGKDYERYKRKSNKVKSTLRKHVQTFEKKIAEQLKTNSKKYWKYAHSKLKSNTKVPDLKMENGTYTETEQEKVDILNKFFSSIFTKEDKTSVPLIDKKFSGSVLMDMDITEQMVLETLQSLKPSKSPGPDGLHPKVLREIAAQIANPLSTMFRASLQTGLIPNTWKLAHVTPIYKKGKKDQKENYRPISLTSVVCRIMERLIKNVLTGHLLENNLFTPDQYGFREFRSCLSQLLEVFEEWTSLLDDNIPVDIVYFDFAKAFDSVPHKRLLTKIKSYGIEGNIYNWIKSFLTGRKQRVVLNGFKSEWTTVISGVPQGSVLGPLLFLLYINDLPDNVKYCQVKIFADDTKIYSPSNRQAQQIQNDIESLKNWSKTWQLPFNSDKCSVLHLGSSNHRNGYYMLDDLTQTHTMIKSVESIRDLGIIADNKFKFDKHIAEIAKKASGVLASIKRTMKFVNKETFNALYKSLVRPILEYCAPVWNPCKVKQIKTLESVQRRATKLVKELKNKSYTERLLFLNLPTLSYRRRRGDMITTFKILHGMIDTDSKVFFERSTSVTRGHNLKLFKFASSSSLRKNYFSNRVINEWNNLPAAIVSAKSVVEFEKLYDDIYGNEKYNYEYA